MAADSTVNSNFNQCQHLGFYDGYPIQHVAPNERTILVCIHYGFSALWFLLISYLGGMTYAYM